MFHKKIRLPLFCFLFSLIIFFSFNSNVFAHGKLTSNNNSSNAEATQTVAQKKPEEVQITTIPVRDNIYMLIGDGGNMGVSVGTDEVIIIDSQFASLTAKIQSAIADISKQPIRYLINTHYHFDHTDGNLNFANAGVTIIAHENVPKQMSVAHKYPIIGMETEGSTAESLPKITFRDNGTFKLDSNQINAFHLPLAHTDGDIVVHFVNQNVIHTGDLFFNGFYPFIDTGVGGSIDGMISGIEKILPLCDEETLIIPGHGYLSNKKELIAFEKMLTTVSNRIKANIAKNMSLQDMIQANILKDLDDTWGKGFLSSEQFLKIAYRGIRK